MTTIWPLWNGRIRRTLSEKEDNRKSSKLKLRKLRKLAAWKQQTKVCQFTVSGPSPSLLFALFNQQSFLANLNHFVRARFYLITNDSIYIITHGGLVYYTYIWLKSKIYVFHVGKYTIRPVDPSWKRFISKTQTDEFRQTSPPKLEPAKCGGTSGVLLRCLRIHW